MSQHFQRVRRLIFAALCVVQAFTPFTSFSAEPTSQQTERSGGSQQLPTVVADKWKSKGAIRVLKGKECEAFPDGEIGLEYGLISTTISHYTDGKDNYSVELFELRYPSGAYGFFTYLQTRGATNQRQFWAGREVIRIRNFRDNKSISSVFFEGLANTFEKENGPLPPLTKHLPQTNKLPGKEHYLVGTKALAAHPTLSFLKEYVNFEGGTEGVAAEYQQAESPLNLLLLEFHTPQLATDGFAKLDALKTSVPQSGQPQTIIKRIGNYVVIANPVKDIKAAESILGEIKYTASVHWEGKSYRAIPLEYRPPDPAALEEASETALILLRTFYWIGLMIALAGIFGVGAGSSFFYWRRYQRKKAGLDDLFSDASGSIRLNLDNESEKTETKLLS